MARELVLDLVFTISNLALQVQDWQVLTLIRSDHHRILFTLQTTLEDLVDTPTSQPRFNIAKVN